MTETPRHAVAVLGCHRSGTSVITRSLLALGAVVGDDLLLPVPGNNITGFWEDREIHLAVQDIQRRAGSDWDELSYGMDTNHHYVAEAALQKVTDLLDAKTSPHFPFAFKNPRVALLMGTFKRALKTLNIEAGYVVAVRDPLSVAESLEARDGLPLEHGVSLWLKYMIESVAATAKSKAVFVHYERMLSAPERELLRIEQALDIGGLRLRPAELTVVRDEFIDLELRHHQHDIEALAEHPAISTDVLAAYKDLCAATEDDPAGGHSLSSSLWKRLARNFEQQAAAWRLIDTSRRGAKSMAAQVRQLETQLTETRDGHVEELERARASEQRIEAEAMRLTRALEAAEGCLRSATAAFETANERERVLEESLSNRSQELTDLVAANEKLSAALEEHQTSVDEKIQAELDSHEASTLRLIAERDEARARLVERAAEEPDHRALEKERERLEVVTAQLIAERDAARAMLARETATVAANTELVEQLRADIGALHASTSWQVSKPLRVVGDLAKRRRGRT